MNAKKLNRLMREMQNSINPLSQLGLAGNDCMDVDSIVKNLLGSAITSYCNENNCSREAFAAKLRKASGNNIQKWLIDKWLRTKGNAFPLKYAHHVAAITGDNRLAHLPVILLGGQVLEPEETIDSKIKTIEGMLTAFSKYLESLRAQRGTHNPFTNKEAFNEIL